MKITVIRKTGGACSKTIAINENGDIVASADDCWIASGVAAPIDLDQPADLADILNECTSADAIVLGCPTEQAMTGMVDGKIHITSAAQLANAPNGAITRSNGYWEFPVGQPGFMAIDADTNQMPDAIRARIDAAGGLWPMLVDVFPELGRAAHIDRPSTSSCLYNSETGEAYDRALNQHIYLPVADVSDAPRALDAIVDRLMCESVLWPFMTKDGRTHARTIVDATVAQPCRLFFEGAPQCRAPLAQDTDARKAVAHDGEIVDTRAVFRDIGPLDRNLLRVNVDQAIADRKDEADRVRSAWVDERARFNVSRTPGLSIEAAIAHAEAVNRGVLAASWPLHLDDGRVITVRDVLLNPKAFHRTTLADPVEPEYGARAGGIGRNKAVILASDERDPVIFSLAHGAQRWTLAQDQLLASERLKLATQDGTIPELISILSMSVLCGQERAELIKQAAKQAGVTEAVVRRAIRNDEREAEVAARRAAAEREAEEQVRQIVGDAPDLRPVIHAPAKDADRLTYLHPMDQAIAENAAGVLKPILRDRDGHLVVVEMRSLTTTHMLVSESERAQRGEASRMAAPPQLVISRMNQDRIGMEVSKLVRIVQRNKDGAMINVRLPPEFASALDAMPAEESSIPVLVGAQTLPLVVGKRLVATSGFDPETGVLFLIDPTLRDVLPDPDECTPEAAIEAYKYLCDELLADVMTDANGKACLVAQILTIIQRHMCSTRPAWFFVAGQSAAGKTTAAHIISLVTTGAWASAMPWSTQEEERKKTLFSILLAGAATAVIDNVARGSEVYDPTLERILTAPTYSDRILGGSSTATASTATVFTFTGNNIRPKGDMANRSLVVYFTTDRQHAERRPYHHANFTEWVMSNRAAILRACYVILVAGAGQVTKGGGKTRFPEWYECVARPIELASGGSVSFEKIIASNTAGDEEATGMMKLLSTLEEVFDGSWFGSADVLTLLTQGGAYSKGDFQERQVKADALRDAINEACSATGSRMRPLPDHGASASFVGQKLSVVVDRVVEIDGRNVKLERYVDQKRGNRYRVVGEMSATAKEGARAQAVKKMLAPFEQHEDEILRGALAAFLAQAGAASVVDLDLEYDLSLVSAAEDLARKLVAMS